MKTKIIKILVIGTDKDDLQIIREMIPNLVEKGFSIDFVNDLKSGIEDLKNQDKYQAVLLELDLPESSGYETFQNLNREFPDVPIIVLTGLADEELAENIVYSGAQDYLVKGEFDERILIRTIKNAISRKMVEYELRDYREHIKLINKILRIDLVNHFAVIKSAINLFSDSEDKSYINDAYNNITKGVELINRISNSEVFKSKYKTLNTYFISDILQSIIEDYPSIEVNIEGNFQVFADDTIYSIFDNIISNALVHGKSEKIDIKMFKKDAICEIRVADDGIGIPDHIKYRIFEEGFKYGETAGSGLGLHIVKKALEKYGGCVYVEDNVPRGAVIVLQFILERRQKPRNDYFKK